MTMIFKKAIARRTFLRGVGTTLALPLLDGMIPAFAAGSDPAQAVRILFMYGPNGRIMKNWTPTIEGSGWEMTPTLKPLAPFRDQMLVLSGLDVKAADPWEGEPGGVHARPCAAYLTGIHPKPNNTMGVSVDQYIAREFGKHTQLGSLEISMESSERVGAGDGAYSDSYSKTISWRGPETPLPMEHNPRKVFERLLGENQSTDPAMRRRMAQKNRSILDFVTGEVARLSAQIGPSDRAKLNEYLDAVRDIERRIQLSEEQASREMPEMERPAGKPATVEEHAKLMFDLMALAFQADLTRVITFMWGSEQHEGDYREIGVADGHHASSHHAGQAYMIENCIKVDAFHSRLFAHLLDRLRSTPDGEGTLLDHSIIVYGSGLSDGMGHVHHDVPTLLVGGGAGKLKGGSHIRYPRLPLSNLHLSILDMVGLPVEDFLDNRYSDSTGRLDVLSI
jgi:hypothetical protein